MTRLAKQLFVALLSVFLFGLSTGRARAMSVSYLAGATTSPCQAQSFFGLVPWYKYLQLDPATCDVKDFHLLPGAGQHSDVLLVGLAIVDDLLRIAGLIAVGFVIYAAISFITSQGNPEDAARARGTVINALVGLVIALVAVVFVQFIGTKLGG